MHDSTCVDCGAPFELRGNKGRPRKRCFQCSPEQKRSRSQPRDHGTADCAVCGDAFKKRSNISTTCSRSCSSKRTQLKRGTPCSICGEPMAVSATSKKAGPAHNHCRTAVTEHGTPGAYRKGCRCPECKQTVADKHRDYADRVRARDGVSPTARYKRIKNGHPVNTALCFICDKPMRTVRHVEGAPPAHKVCRGRFYVSPAVRLGIFERDNWKCHLCGKKTDPDAGRYEDHYPTLDHLKPRSKGGSDESDNLATACLWCNCSRGNREVEDFLELARGMEWIT